MDKHDDAFGNLCEAVTGRLLVEIADGTQIPGVALELFSALTERILKHRDWAYAASSGHADNELVSMVKDLFFELPYAGGAVRFANRNWRDVEKIIPVFEPILRAHGSVEFVARFWMSGRSEHRALSVGALCRSLGVCAWPRRSSRRMAPYATACAPGSAHPAVQRALAA